MATPVEVHPLENHWTLWYDSKKAPTKGAAPKKEGEENWEEHLVQVDTISSVEAFWVMMNQIKKPTSLELSANYHFFKKGVKPMWEDSANRQGGKWVLTLTTKEDLFRLDQLWEELLMGMIGEYLDEGVPGNHIMGAVLGKRRHFVKISLWTRDCKAEAELDEVRKKLVAILNIDPKETDLQYTSHTAHSQTVAK